MVMEDAGLPLELGTAEQHLVMKCICWVFLFVYNT